MITQERQDYCLHVTTAVITLGADVIYTRGRFKHATREDIMCGQRDLLD